MQVKEFHLEYSRPDIFRIHPVGDIHLGTLHCAEDLLEQKVNEIKSDPFSYWIDMGDSAEFITPHDPRWDSGAMPEWLHPNNIGVDQATRYCEIMEPIAGKCIGKIKGNHEASIEQHSDIDVQRNICETLNVDNLDSACFIKFIFSRKGSTEKHSYLGFFTHGAGGAVTAGAKLTRLQRLMDNFDADIVACGHVHDILTYVRPYMTLDASNKIKQRVKVGAITGCYFKTYTQGVSSSYGEKKNYPPVTLGSPVFIINPDKGILRVENG